MSQWQHHPLRILLLLLLLFLPLVLCAVVGEIRADVMQGWQWKSVNFTQPRNKDTECTVVALSSEGRYEGKDSQNDS